jgi:hypothetical protein
MARGARSIYCTCAETRPAVVSYLLNSGMLVQARLRSHLGDSRDELVFATYVGKRSAKIPRLSWTPAPGRTIARRVMAGTRNCTEVIKFFVAAMPYWYFRPPKALASVIMESLKVYEAGDRAYSSKGRLLFAVMTASGRPAAAALLTLKRSQMVKINLVSVTRTERVIGQLLRSVLAATTGARRAYLTVPIVEHVTCSQILRAGFRFEGVLDDPFGTGLDHACFGLVRGSRGTNGKSVSKPRMSKAGITW